MMQSNHNTKLLMIAALALTAGTGCFSDADGAGAFNKASQARMATACLTADDAERIADQVLQLVNLERSAADRGLAPVAMNDKLVNVAADYACRMIELDFFDHEDPFTGRGAADRAIAGKYSIFAIGENLAAGPESAAGVMESWMESPSHRAIILDPMWTEIGIAVRSGGEYGYYWVQLFADPAPTSTRRLQHRD